MKICMMHDLDTGFLSATLKPAFEALGHDCVVMQTLKTYLDEEGTHIDYLMGQMTDEDIGLLKDEFEDTDFFILRSLTDTTLRLSGVLPYLNKHNTIYKVHGSELREKNVPYSLRTWMMDWYGNEPIVCGPRDPSLLDKYQGHVITHIERPLDFSKMPIKKKKGKYAITTPTNLYKKGTEELMAKWKCEIPLKIISGVSREEVLKEKAGASYYIDRIGEYNHGPYGMNSVEAWYLKIPVFSEYGPWDEAICPDLRDLVINVDKNTVEKAIKGYKVDRKSINKAYKYVIDNHNPIKIARQYVMVAYGIKSM